MTGGTDSAMGTRRSRATGCCSTVTSRWSPSMRAESCTRSAVTPCRTCPSTPTSTAIRWPRRACSGSSTTACCSARSASRRPARESVPAERPDAAGAGGAGQAAIPGLWPSAQPRRRRAGSQAQSGAQGSPAAGAAVGVGTVGGHGCGADRAATIPERCRCGQLTSYPRPRRAQVRPEPAAETAGARHGHAAGLYQPGRAGSGRGAAQYGIPAAVTIAQAIDESGWGQSELATRPQPVRDQGDRPGGHGGAAHGGIPGRQG